MKAIQYGFENELTDDLLEPIPTVSFEPPEILYADIPTEAAVSIATPFENFPVNTPETLNQVEPIRIFISPSPENSYEPQPASEVQPMIPMIDHIPEFNYGSSIYDFGYNGGNYELPEVQPMTEPEPIRIYLQDVPTISANTSGKLEPTVSIEPPEILYATNPTTTTAPTKTTEPAADADLLWGFKRQHVYLAGGTAAVLGLFFLTK